MGMTNKVVIPNETTPLCEKCHNPMKVLFSSFYCDCEDEQQQDKTQDQDLLSISGWDGTVVVHDGDHHIVYDGGNGTFDISNTITIDISQLIFFMTLVT